MSLDHFKYLDPGQRCEQGINEHGVLMCECGNKRPHAYEPGEWCSPVRVLPKSAQPLHDSDTQEPR